MSAAPSRREGAVLLIAMAVAAGSAGAQTFQEQVVELTNVERWVNGMLPPHKLQSSLMSAAQSHSQNMATRNFLMHCDPDTLTEPWDRMTQAGYSWNAAAENIAAGQSTPATVVAGWMLSQGHRANILSNQYRETGAGYVLDSGDSSNVRTNNNGSCGVQNSNGGPYQRYWTQVFGAHDDVYPLVIAREAYAVSLCQADIYAYGTGWAQEMRFSSNGNNWGAWTAYSANSTRTLSGTTSASVFVQLRNGATVRSASDTVQLNLPCDGTQPNAVFANGFN